MHTVPNVDEYDDPVRYLRAMHAAILERVGVLEVHANESSSARESIAELLTFFGRTLPIHERDEEESLFPVLIEKSHRVGFQPVDPEFEFLHRDHDRLNAQNRELFEQLESEESSDTWRLSAATFAANIREHIANEDRLVYANANDRLSPEERIAIMQALKQRHQRSVAMPSFQFDQPTSSMPIGLSFADPADAVADQWTDSDDESDDDDDE